ncbi:hypothetical protein DLAC_08787 [Tieghemostelium lacteum]|uniref:Uncharacterized protein n=1 Tax=Tieghemostelium lacteum TaxID=361077 RepID=A0A151Z892_TIELA|nr:hypothetical protein DLAC_08787 [Tieghemostelium lacteum]|eukprot:KYQ90189.1 hypothetical protein DLAC_08787 [Tieghemostelium lacteum]
MTSHGTPDYIVFNQMDKWANINNLVHMDIGEFNLEIPQGSLPKTLECLIIKGYTHAILPDTLPHGLLKLVLGVYNNSLDYLPWTIESIVLGTKFNFHINHLPVRLRSLKMGNIFNKNLLLHCLPPTLKKLHLSRAFNQQLENGHLNQCDMELLVFGKFFNYPLNRDWIPTSLLYLCLSDMYNQPISYLPDKLIHLRFGNCFNVSFSFKLPSTLKILEFGSSFNQDNITEDIIPPSVTYLFLGSSFNQPIKYLPPNLEKLYLPSFYKHPICKSFLNHKLKIKLY